MSANKVPPEMKQIVGAMVFAAGRPVGVSEMHKCLVEVAEARGKEAAAFADVRPADVKAAVAELEQELVRRRCGFFLKEVSSGFVLESDAACGPWLRHLLDENKPRRLSMPALETLAIIAYRQPISRAEIEGVRGVAVDHVVKLLMELRLVRITSRSKLPGRPFLYGTTQNFLDHFGLKGLKELESIGPGILASLERDRARNKRAAAAMDEASKSDGADRPAADGEMEPDTKDEA